MDQQNTIGAAGRSAAAKKRALTMGAAGRQQAAKKAAATRAAGKAYAEDTGEQQGIGPSSPAADESSLGSIHH